MAADAAETRLMPENKERAQVNLCPNERRKPIRESDSIASQINLSAPERAS